MKKSRLQVLIDFVSTITKIQGTKKPVNKTFTSIKKNLQALAAVLLFAGVSSTFATNYYTKASGNWNVPGTWSTIGYGNPTNSGTFPTGGDVAFIGDGYTVILTTNAAVGSVNVGQGVSGTLSFNTTLANSLTVSGNLMVNTGATFNDVSAVNQVKSVIIGGNFSNFGTVDLYNSAACLANLTFNGATNAIVSGSGTWDLNSVDMSKSTSTTIVEAQQNAFENAIRVLYSTRGTYIHNNAGTFNIPGSTVNYTITRNCNFKCLQGAMNFAPAGSILYLQGGLYVNGGNVTVGNNASTIGIATQNSGVTPYLEVTSGTLDVKAGISYNQGVPTPGSFSFKMTGGTVTLNTGIAGCVRNIFFVNDVAGSIFDMSGGTIILERANVASPNIVDFGVCGSNGTVSSTAGIIQFGNNNTPAGNKFNFMPFPNVTQPHFKVTGKVGNAISLAPSQGTTVNFKLMSLYIDFGKTFDIRSINNAFGDSKQMTLMSTFDGVNAFYNDGIFTARQSTVTFNTSGAQSIGGSTVTTFYNLSINNANHITLNKAANVQNFLGLVNGKLYTTNANVLTILSNGSASIGANNTYVEGPMVHTVATASTVTKTYPIGKNGAYRPVVLTVQHTNNTSVTYRAEIFNSPASGLPFTLPPTIANVSTIRYVQFTRQNVANFFQGRIQMYYDTDDGVLDYTSLLVAHDDGVSQWQNFGGTATANITGNITSAIFNNFHTYFALGNPPGGGNPLPVELTAFNARLSNRRVFTDWTTASELNNDYFTLQRSADNVNFSTIAVVNGNGTTSQVHRYEYVDESPLSGMSYYRLSQTDFDGKITTFQTVAVFNSTRSKFDIFPNPSADNTVNLTYEDNDLNGVAVYVQDITGKIIPSHTVKSESMGELKLVIDETYTSHGGIFIVTANTGTQILKQRLIISRK
jgi:hypothetical protein